MFCFEFKIIKKLIYFQFDEKENNFACYFPFIFNSKQLKFNLKLTNICRFDEWQLSATILVVTCLSSKDGFVLKLYGPLVTTRF